MTDHDRTTDDGGAVVLTLPRVPVASVQGTLALDLEPLLEPPDPRPRGGRDLLPGQVAGSDLDVVQQRRFERHAARIGAAVVEIVGGARPVSQLLRWTTPQVYEDLARRAHLVARSVGQHPGQAHLQAVRPHLVAAHSSWVSERVVEVSFHVRYGARSRAVAARFELIRDRWQVSALEFA